MLDLCVIKSYLKGVSVLETSFQSWFDDLYLENSLKMIQTAQRLLGNAETAEDIVQNVFIILLAKKDQVMLHPCPQAWLFATLRNLIGNELQKQRHRDTTPLNDNSGGGYEDRYSFPLCDCLPPGLSDSEKDILSMLFEAGYSYKEISYKTGRSELACRLKFYRAKVHCRELLTKSKKVET